MAGADTEGVEFLVPVEQLIPDYRDLYGEWVVSDPQEREGFPIRQFAMEKLTELDAGIFELEYDLKRHVYALGKLAGRSVAQSRALSKTCGTVPHSLPRCRTK